MRTVLLSGIAVLALAGGAVAHPGHGAGGPPSTVTMGPPSAAFSHVPNSDAHADSGVAAGANLLGSLNAAHASSTALAHASPKSMVGAIAAYKTAVSKAEAQLQIDQAQLAADLKAGAPQATINADNQAIANDNLAILAAQNTLALRANKPLTPAVVAQLNTLLGL